MSIQDELHSAQAEYRRAAAHHNKCKVNLVFGIKLGKPPEVLEELRFAAVTSFEAFTDVMIRRLQLELASRLKRHTNGKGAKL